MAFPLLNLPEAPLRLRRRADGRLVVFCPLRRRWVVLTAEEWVRQHFVHFLTAYRNFPTGLLANEIGIEVGGVSRRCDTVLFAREEARPRLIVEYKAPHIAINEAVFTQIQGYNSVLHADWMVVSNGLRHFCCRMDYDARRVTFFPKIPHYSEL